MKNFNLSIGGRVPFPVQLILFWWLVFLFFRILFVLLYSDHLSGGTAHILNGLFFAGIRVDLSLICYISAFPSLIWIVMNFTNTLWFKNIIRIYHLLIIPLIITILVSNLGLYGSWETLLNRRLLLYLEKPSEIVHFMDTWKIISLPVILIAVSWLFYWLYNKITDTERWIIHPVPRTIILILFIPLTFLGMRGGWQLVPVNESASAYSPYPANNHLAINPVFYFGHSVSEYFYLTNKFVYYDAAEADNYLNQFFDSRQEYIEEKILNTEKPNVVIILLESWTADILAHNGELNGVTPFTDSLINSSVWFKNAYASGYRTDQGLVSVISGFPSQPDNTIISYPGKTEKLNALSDELKHNGYQNSFFYGGDIEFANMKLFLLQHSFEHIYDKTAFNPSEYNSKWGAHDGPVLDKQISYLASEKTPFLSCVLTLSTHEPFEVPVETPFNGSDESEKFKKAAWYTDQCLKNYFAKAQQTEWYKNTLFILTADHGHYLPLHRDLSQKESKKITFLMTGPVIKSEWRGKVIEKTVAQHDIAGTLMRQLNLENKFEFSRNIFENSPGFGFYCNEVAAGIVTDTADYNFFFDNETFKGNPALQQLAKAYLQKTYSAFISK